MAPTRFTIDTSELPVNFSMPLEKPLGSITQGSLSKGLEVRLHADVSVEEMRVGKFLVVHGTRSRFFCMLTVRSPIL